MLPGVSEMWEEVGGFTALAPWRFEPVTENNVAESAWMCHSSSQKEMESLTRALQRELCDVRDNERNRFADNELMSFANNEMSFAASLLMSDWKCKVESKLSSEMNLGNGRVNLCNNNVTEMESLKSSSGRMNPCVKNVSEMESLKSSSGRMNPCLNNVTEMESLKNSSGRMNLCLNNVTEMESSKSSSGRMNLCKNNVTEMESLNSSGVFEGLNLSKSDKFNEVEKEKSLFLRGGGSSESEALIAKAKISNSLSIKGGGKISKRRSRAACKTPITFLNADPANFRAMVQQVTGVPLNPTANRLWQPLTNGGAATAIPALLKPEPKRISCSSASSIIQGLPTLDTSALFIHTARQNPNTTDFRSYTKNNGGGGNGNLAVDHVNIVAEETDSWLNGSNLDGILIGSSFELAGGGSLPA